MYADPYKYYYSKRTYAIGSREGSYFKIRDLMTDDTIFSLNKPELEVHYTADGKNLVTTSNEGVKIWQYSD